MRNRPANRTIRLVYREKGNSSAQAMLTVPIDIAEHLVRNGVRTFHVELTEEGILYRPTTQEMVNEEMPTWLGGKNGKARRARKQRPVDHAERTGSPELES